MANIIEFNGSDLTSSQVHHVLLLARVLTSNERRGARKFLVTTVQSFAENFCSTTDLPPRKFCCLFFEVESRKRLPFWSIRLGNWMETDSHVPFTPNMVPDLFECTTDAELFTVLSSLIKLMASVELNQTDELFSLSGVEFDVDYVLTDAAGERLSSPSPIVHMTHSFVVAPSDIAPTPFGGALQVEQTDADAGDILFTDTLPIVKSSRIDVQVFKTFMASQAIVNAQNAAFQTSTEAFQSQMLSFMERLAPPAGGARLPLPLDTPAPTSPSGKKVRVSKSKPIVAQTPETRARPPSQSLSPSKGTSLKSALAAPSVYSISDEESSVISTSTSDEHSDAGSGASASTSTGQPVPEIPGINEAKKIFHYGGAKPFKLPPFSTIIYMLKHDGLVFAMANGTVLLLRKLIMKKCAADNWSTCVLRYPLGVEQSITHMPTICQFPRSAKELVHFFSEQVALVGEVITECTQSVNPTLLVTLSTFQSKLTGYIDQYVAPENHVTRYSYVLLTLITLFNSAFLWNDLTVLDKLDVFWDQHIKFRISRTPTVEDLQDAALFLFYRCPKSQCSAHGSLPNACSRCPPVPVTTAGPSEADLNRQRTLDANYKAAYALAHVNAAPGTVNTYNSHQAFKKKHPQWKDHVPLDKYITHYKNKVVAPPSVEAVLQSLVGNQSSIPVPNGRRA